jgi:hypothetical protein
MKHLDTRRTPGWISVYYDFGQKYGYEDMLRFFDEAIAKDRFRVQRIMKAEIADAPWENVTGAFDLDNVSLQNSAILREECGVVTIAGISSMLRHPVMLILYNQTSVLCIQMPESAEDPSQEDIDAYADFLGEISER